MAQPVYEHVSHHGIYEFLDEMANLGVIELSSVVKPYTRGFIRQKLHEAEARRDALNTRQREMVCFYLAAFEPEIREKKGYLNLARASFVYHDSLFVMQLRPVLGASVLGDVSGSGNAGILRYHRYNGAEAWASVGRNWGFYASLRDNFHSANLVEPEFLVDETGGVYKPGNAGSVEFSEMRGGILYGNDWITFGLIKDHPEWGNHYHGANIFTPHTPSLVHLRLNLRPVRWLEFNYFHAWLNSGLIDSARTYTYTNAYGTRQRYVYREKYLAANMFTFRPWKNTWISIGNSIVYADIGLHPAYLIPVAFFKSMDHTVNNASNRAGQNSQMYLDFSTRRIRNTHLFATLFIDEIATTRMFDPDDQSNCISLKTGFRISDFPVQDLHLTAEYTRTHPLVYQHFTPSTTFESNGFNLGHYLRDNAEESCISLIWEPFRKFRATAGFRYARKGPDYDALGGKRSGLPFLEEERWHRSELMLATEYHIFYNAYAQLTYLFSRTGGVDAPLYHPPELLGKKHLLSLALMIGL